MKTGLRLIATLLAALLLALNANAQHWPTFRNDSARSGVSDFSIDASRLQLEWEWHSPLPPDPAWDGPARWDAYNQIRDLPAMRQYDACFHPVSDGKTVYFGSSSQDVLRALNIEDGTESWSFVAGGPIRLAPTIHDDRLLFGCDDGNAYCLDRNSGTLIWKFNPSPFLAAEQRRLINNDRLISYYPIRTGITVRDNVAYFGASFLPWRESFICAIDATTGEVEESKIHFIVKHDNATLEGNLLVAENRLIVPQGRIAPLMFDRTNGESLGSLPGGGGVTIVLTESGDVVRSEGGAPARSGQMGVFQGKERVASFPRGRAIIVRDACFYVIDGQKLFAAERATNALKWNREVDEPLEIIMAGNTIFVGGRDHVTAVDAENGQVVWSAEVQGRTFGLAIAGDRLLASTDSGNVYAFSPNAATQWVQKIASNNDPEWKSPNVDRVRTQNLLHRWVFHRSAMQSASDQEVTGLSLSGIKVNDQAGDVQLRLAGEAEAIQVGESQSVEAIELNGGMFPLGEDDSRDLPDQSISVEAWVRVDEPTQWGGIVGFIQDDGNTEHGWLLGYRDDKFCFALAGGGNGLTYLTATDSFAPKSWNHVVGTYNGDEMRLYVNGSLAANSSAESGPISYAGKQHFTVGAYKDINESFPLVGALHEVRIYSHPLDATTIAKEFAARASEFQVPNATETRGSSFVSWGPVASYLNPGEIKITYGTTKECDSIIDLINENQVQRHTVNKLTTEHEVVISGMPYRRELQFQIRDDEAEDANASQSYSLDTHFDWTQSRSAPQQPWVTELLTESTNPRGLALVLGAEWVDQAEQLASQSELSVVLVVDNEKTATEIRNRWMANPELNYGRELCVTLSTLPQLPAASATAVLSKNSGDVVRRLVRPEGGILHDGNSVVWHRDPVEGSGVWSHMYGQADNSAFGGEQLGGATERRDLVTQWIGRPGPRYQTDRQNRKPSPLAAGGRLFLQGQQRMIALDSFSGVVLWSAETPTVMRWNVPHDCSNWCADSKGIFVAAENQAWFMDGRNGQITRQFELPGSAKNAPGKSWGFVSRYKNQLLGTAVASSAIYTNWWGKSQWFDSTGGDDTHVVAGDQLFSLNFESGELQWSYDGLILHPTITVMDDCIFFVEDKTPDHLNIGSSRISLDEDQQHELVCLDIQNGDLKWRKSIAPFAGHIASLYLAGGGNAENRSLVLVASESTMKQFTVQTLDPKNGETIWAREVDWEANHHGKHISRPAIQGELLYLRPEVLSLADGQTFRRGFPGGHGCSSYTLSANGLFSRLGETTWWDARNDKVNRFNRIRTDCWISVVPAQGMLLSAEGGGGCSCGSWLETSLGLLPRSVDETLPEK